jgi:cell wall assembly regulator SMI1
MADRISDGVIAKLRERAGNPAERCDGSNMSAHSAPAGDMMRVLGSVLDGTTMFGAMGGGMFSVGGSGERAPAPPPCQANDVAAAESDLGFPLPRPLRQFYMEVADGGVGPGEGLYSLGALRAKWREMTREPVGPRGQEWPASLLPIHGERWDLTCIGLETGKISCFDPEELGHSGWKKAFKPQAENLEAWLSDWLDGPGAGEKIQDELSAAKARWAEEEIAKLETRSETYRAGHGYSGDDWRNEVRRRFGAPLR